MRLISLGVLLFCFWLLLSGHYTSFLIAVGIACSAGVAALAWHMNTADEEGHPINLLPRALVYWPWLVLEMIKSAWAVSKIIIDPALPISPTLVRIKASQKKPLGVSIYANSITLTPGTVSVEVEDDEITVHALQSAGADALEEGEMDRRVAWMEGR